jgi:Flp pilus assembly CpaE family ATPase
VSAGVSVLSTARTMSGPAEGGPAPQAVAAVIDSLRRGVRLVVVDLARHLGPEVHAVLDVATLVVIVVPAEVRAAAAAAHVASQVTGRVVDVRLLVRGPSPSGLPAEAIAEQVGLPLQGWLPAEPGLAEALDRGDLPARSGRGPLARACRALLDELVPARSTAVKA